MLTVNSISVAINFARLYFRRHMECAVLKRFLKVQETFSKKVSCKSHFSIWEKLNLIRFIKTLIRGFTPHSSRFAQHLLPRRRLTLPSGLRLTPSLSGTALKIAKFIFNRKKAFKTNCFKGFLLKVSLEPFQRLTGVDSVHGL